MRMNFVGGLLEKKLRRSFRELKGLTAFKKKTQHVPINHTDLNVLRTSDNLHHCRTFHTISRVNSKGLHRTLFY